MSGTGKEKKGSMSIKTRLIAVTIPIIFVVTFVFFALSRNVIIRLSKEELAARSEVYAMDIYAWADKILGELQVYKDSIEDGGFKNDAQILAYMETSVEKNDAYPIGLYMGDDSGVYLDASGWVPDDDWVLVERDWYLEGKDHDQIAFGEPYYDSQSGDICVSATVRMDYPDAARVLAVDVYLNYLSEIITEVDEDSQDISSFLVTKESGTIIAHPEADMIAVTLDAEGIDRLYKNVLDTIKGGQTGLVSVKGDRASYFVCINEIPDTDWILVSYISRREVLGKLYRLEIFMIAVAAAAALVLIFVSLRIMNRVVKPVARVTDVIKNVSDGDFSQNIEVKGNDEIARMSAHTQEFLVQMRQTIAEIMKISEVLKQQSEDNDRVSGSLTDSSQNLSEAMELLHDRVNELSMSAEQVSKQMEHLAGIIDEADANGKEAGNMMRQTVEISQDGRRAAESVSDGMDHIESSISSLSAQIMETDAAMEQIGTMVEMIVNVAEETSLLSLNASIEAARAGDAGKGFAVVAEQIGKLAVNSGAAADDISQLTTKIKDAMQNAVQRMQESVEEVKRSAVLVNQNRDNFERVYKRVGETNQIVESMVALVGNAETVSEDMKKIAEGQLAYAGEITGSVAQLAGYTKSVREDSDTVAKNAKELEKESKNLLDRVSGFRI